MRERVSGGGERWGAGGRCGQVGDGGRDGAIYLPAGLFFL